MAALSGVKNWSRHAGVDRGGVQVLNRPPDPNDFTRLITSSVTRTRLVALRRRHPVPGCIGLVGLRLRFAVCALWLSLALQWGCSNTAKHLAQRLLTLALPATSQSRLALRRKSPSVAAFFFPVCFIRGA